MQVFYQNTGSIVALYTSIFGRIIIIKLEEQVNNLYKTITS